MMYIDPVSVSQRTLCLRYKGELLFTAVYYENHTKNLHMLCGQKAECLVLKHVLHIVATGLRSNGNKSVLGCSVDVRARASRHSVFSLTICSGYTRPSCNVSSHVTTVIQNERITPLNCYTVQSTTLGVWARSLQRGYVHEKKGYWCEGAIKSVVTSLKNPR